MHIKSYEVSPHNAHYSGEYPERALEWRRICSNDKAGNIQALLGKRKVSSVLDVGCGTGSVLAELIQRNIGDRHVGVDVVDPSEHLDQNAKGLDLRRYDGDRLPWPDNSFDFVYASHVVEHVPDPRGFLQELARVSSRYVYVEVPCEITVRSNPAAVQSALYIGHINAYTPDYFQILIQTAGLKIVDLTLFDHSLEVHNFGRPYWKGRAMQIMRSTMLKLRPNLAAKLFCYHCGALIDCSGD